MDFWTFFLIEVVIALTYTDTSSNGWSDISSERTSFDGLIHGFFDQSSNSAGLVPYFDFDDGPAAVNISFRFYALKFLGI